MKIVQVIPTLEKAGGAERFVVDLSVALKQLGHHVLIVVLYNDKVNFFQKEVDSYNLDIIFLNKKKGLDFKNSLLLKKVLLNFRPDVIHTHIQSHLSMKLTHLWKKNSDMKFFHTIHNVPEMECSKPILFNIMKPLYKKKIVNPIAISNSLAVETSAYYGLKYLPKTIYNGIFIKSFLASTSLNNRKYTFISVASFQPKKNQMMIAQATITLKEKGYPVNTLFVGSGDQFENVKTFVKDKRATDYISFVGQVKNVNDYLQNSKCFVIPSLFEGNPISILEAMAAGLAIIATNVGGPKDVIKDNENGFLVDPMKLDELIKKMEQILLNPDLIETFSHNNIEKVKKYEMLNVAKEYLKVYNE